jgi:hypothetical protein
VPQLSIRGAVEAPPSAKIDQIKWIGLRCRITVSGQTTGCQVDLRDKANDAATSLTSPKPVAADGSVALIVENDEREGSATILVLLDKTGTVIDKMPVTVGE